ncbi:MAG: hypothetical protein QNK23_05075 [Crocinitomicaceae bacterium]|nr:hypothetical protein [Crocinitomicaceae bacterium]
MKVLSILAAGLLLISCANTKETTAMAPEEAQKPQRNIAVTAQLGEFKKGDALTITRSKVEGNILYLMVAYSGGCTEHTFEVIGNPILMKSLPPKRSVQLVHHANGDTCREWIEQTLEIDLSALAADQTPGSEVILVVEGIDQELSYIFE